MDLLLGLHYSLVLRPLARYAATLGRASNAFLNFAITGGNVA